MKKSTNPTLTEMAVQAMNDAVAKVVEDHRRRGMPLAVWRNGRAVWVAVGKNGALRETPPPYGVTPSSNPREASQQRLKDKG